MARWLAEFLPEAGKDIASLEPKIRARIIEKLDWFSNNFDEAIPIPLVGEYRQFYKLRVGDWRVFYKTDYSKKVLVVCHINHRSRVYKSKKR